MPLSLRMSKMRLFQNIFNHNAYRKNDEKDHHDMRFSIPAEKFASNLPAYHCHPLASKWALSQYLNIA